MANIVIDFLRGKTAVATHHRTWEWQTTPLPLQENIYLSPTLPPDELISSARVILRRGDEVMVIQDHENQPYIIPGGRREPGETILETLHREIGEETGWTVRELAVLGFYHFRHLAPKPDDYPYPHPHFSGPSSRPRPTSMSRPVWRPISTLPAPASTPSMRC